MRNSQSAVVGVIKKSLLKQLKKGREWVKAKILCWRYLLSWFLLSTPQILSASRQLF